MSVERHEWVCCSTDPSRDKYEAEMAGRKLHAVAVEDPRDHGNGSDLAFESACGRWARHGWCGDLFNTEKCRACLRALGVACPACNAKRLRRQVCAVCLGSGEAAGASPQGDSQIGGGS